MCTIVKKDNEVTCNNEVGTMDILEHCLETSMYVLCNTPSENLNKYERISINVDYFDGTACICAIPRLEKLPIDDCLKNQIEGKL